MGNIAHKNKSFFNALLYTTNLNEPKKKFYFKSASSLEALEKHNTTQQWVELTWNFSKPSEL